MVQAVATDRTLAVGLAGPDVGKAQEAINKILKEKPALAQALTEAGVELINGQLKVDKIYGENTRAAVAAIQGAFGAKVDGQLGSETRSRMAGTGEPNLEQANSAIAQFKPTTNTNASASSNRDEQSPRDAAPTPNAAGAPRPATSPAADTSTAPIFSGLTLPPPPLNLSGIPDELTVTGQISGIIARANTPSAAAPTAVATTAPGTLTPKEVTDRAQQILRSANSWAAGAENLIHPLRGPNGTLLGHGDIENIEKEFGKITNGQQLDRFLATRLDRDNLEESYLLTEATARLNPNREDSAYRALGAQYAHASLGSLSTQTAQIEAIEANSNLKAHAMIGLAQIQYQLAREGNFEEISRLSQVARDRGHGQLIANASKMVRQASENGVPLDALTRQTASNTEAGFIDTLFNNKPQQRLARSFDIMYDTNAHSIALATERAVVGSLPTTGRNPNETEINNARTALSRGIKNQEVADAFARIFGEPPASYFGIQMTA